MSYGSNQLYFGQHGWWHRDSNTPPRVDQNGDRVYACLTEQIMDSYIINAPRLTSRPNGYTDQEDLETVVDNRLSTNGAGAEHPDQEYKDAHRFTCMLVDKLYWKNIEAWKQTASKKIVVHAKCSTVLGMNTNSKTKNKIQNMSTDNWLRTCCEFDFSFIKWKFDRMSIRRYVYGQSIFHLLWMRFLLTCLEQRQHDRTRL